MIDQMKAELEKDPANLEKRIMLANIYYDAGRFAEAAPLYEEAMKIDPKNTDVVVDLGVCLRNQGKFMEALTLFQKAEQMEPGKKQALFNTVVVYAFDLKDKPKALEALKRLEAEFPGDEMVKRLADEVRKAA